MNEGLSAKKAWILPPEHISGEVYTIIEFKDGTTKVWSSERGDITDEIKQIEPSNPLEFSHSFTVQP